MSRDITLVQADIEKLGILWQTAQQQYAARKAALSAEVDSYIASHATAAGNHNLEIQAAQKLKATLVPAVAAVETAGADAEDFLLTQPWYQRLVAFFQRNARWLVYGGALVAMGWVIVHLHK